ncbi:hypothetical protein ABID82_007282 [Methylobacterium sp. PvP062]|uniref:Uncharacterized protein n=1 Tax=Methylobacterium radiotolerans TaxID=31998 RepID=A0ABV2NPY7_9HYPH|nr:MULTISPECIES: hypothetical protein [unclassified Methylobacterium]MBP2494698.1 hypothetical protein [Methylobacterium sp. PvP105]MBP2494953.1 hypothetical protein [Methylobacterium sp. PvP105]MBP2505176.1 hypothetical protein [Methylobacterium sp. PvP109]MBP2505431.1 hypothetical protein [Methylobacterium sp. PvP109]
MPKATDQEILAASYALRVARADLNVAFDAEMAAERELVARRQARDEARSVADRAHREFDRLLELRDHPSEQA